MRRLAGAIAGLAAIGALAWMVWPPVHPGGHFADARDAPRVRQGRRLYAVHCASCHGRYLQGQPLWQMDDPDHARRAPALDQTGHTWQQSDDALFRTINAGRNPRMPAYAGRLDDADILALVAFLKARLPSALRIVQATYNPGGSGMPPEAAQSDWLFPAQCRVRAAPP